MKYYFRLIHQNEKVYLAPVEDKVAKRIAADEADVEFEIPIVEGKTYVFYTLHIYPGDFYPHIAQIAQEREHLAYAEEVRL